MTPRATWVVCALAGLGATATLAADAAIDAGLLEFLGSFDGDDAEFIDYLEQQPARPVADSAAGKAPEKKAPEPEEPADPKQVKKP